VNLTMRAALLELVAEVLREPALPEQQNPESQQGEYQKGHTATSASTRH
jgi:hypothetical protein